MIITQEQALELADKYLLHTGRVALRDNISVSKSVEGWRIVAKTIPIILGMNTEMTAFSIDGNTGEVGASITTVVSLTDILKEINERKDVDEKRKEQLKTKVKEFEEEAMKKPVDKNKIENSKKWFEKNAPYLKSLIDLITEILRHAR
jgi:hypothetical protein